MGWQGALGAVENREGGGEGKREWEGGIEEHWREGGRGLPAAGGGGGGVDWERYIFIYVSQFDVFLNIAEGV